VRAFEAITNGRSVFVAGKTLSSSLKINSFIESGWCSGPAGQRSSFGAADHFPVPSPPLPIVHFPESMSGSLTRPQCSGPIACTRITLQEERVKMASNPQDLLTVHRVRLLLRFGADHRHDTQSGTVSCHFILIRESRLQTISLSTLNTTKRIL
jgi:hypothetical protein